MEYNTNQTNINIVAEDATAYGSCPFEVEFARRTLANLRYVESEIDRRHALGIEDKDIHDVFEVTQLINSFVGMLILPKEKYFGEMANCSTFESEGANVILHNLENNTQKYHSTYTFIDRRGIQRTERLTPKNLARHFRNAVAHNHLTILPKDNKGDGVITGVEFSDENNRGESFWLKLNLDEIKTLLFALCRMILRTAKNG